MRKFSSYGPIDTDLHYYAPRKALLAHAYTQLMGDDPEKGGHYITVWAPRQVGKSWTMQQILFQLHRDDRFDAVKINLETVKMEPDLGMVLAYISGHLAGRLGRKRSEVSTLKAFERIFAHNSLEKPLILILDEFDALHEDVISSLVGIFRNVYTSRRDDARPSAEKEFLLHGVALIGVRSVLGIENATGSPFNVQRSLHIPNLTYDEVEGMFRWYERESGRQVDTPVIEQVYYETNGQPGLTCWLGELLTEGFEDYRPSPEQPLTMEDFRYVYMWATQGLPNNTILNIISKAKQIPYKDVVLELFKTEEKMIFAYHKPRLNFLYMNGVLTVDRTPQELYVKFANPFVQKALFQYFSDELFHYTGKLHEPFENLTDVFTDDGGLHIRNLMKRFEKYLQKNRHWLLEDAPRRKDLRLYEAVYHFCLYRFLCDFLGIRHAAVHPEFPTGNGQIDLLIRYQDTSYGLELKSFTNDYEYREALKQAARYGKQLQLPEISLISFVEYIDEKARQTYEAEYVDADSGVKVMPVFVVIGSSEEKDRLPSI